MLLLLVEDAVFGQQQVQEERGDRADGVGRLQEDDQSRPVRVLALIVVVAAAAVVVGTCARRLGLGQPVLACLSSIESARRLLSV